VEEKISFEEALSKLERTVKELEEGNMPLDQLLKCFEKGVGLVKTCHKKLDEAERKIDILLQDLAEPES